MGKAGQQPGVWEEPGVSSTVCRGVQKASGAVSAQDTEGS